MGVALLSVGGVALEDELLATALRLLGSPHGDEVSAANAEEIPTHPRLSPVPHLDLAKPDTPTLPNRSPGQSKEERMEELRRRFAAWVPLQEPGSGQDTDSALIKNRVQSLVDDVCLSDLREVIESTYWFHLGDDALDALAPAEVRPSAEKSFPEPGLA